MASDALEDVERLEAVAAPIMGLARRRAEFADALHRVTATTRTSHIGRRASSRCGNAERLQLPPPLLGQPLARPRRRQHRLDDHLAHPCTRQRIANGALN